MKFETLRRRILWAVDPFGESELQLAALAAVQAVFHRPEIEIEPVHVVNRSPLGIPSRKLENILDQIELSATEEFEQMTARSGESRLLPLKLLTGDYRSRRDAIRDLLLYAQRTGSELIAAGTHARKGPKRWFTGSFAETLMIESMLPVLLVNPHWKPVEKNEGILFPTDFSDESRAAFDLVIDLASEIGSPITIFHQLPTILAPVYDLGEYPVLTDLYRAMLGDAKAKAESWIACAELKGVSARLEIHERSGGSPADAILAYAEHRNDLIALAARSGAVTAALLGSTTRDVVRGARSPVWVIHPRPADRSQRSPLVVLSSA